MNLYLTGQKPLESQGNKEIIILINKYDDSYSIPFFPNWEKKYKLLVNKKGI